MGGFEQVDDSHQRNTEAIVNSGSSLDGIVGISTSGVQYQVNPANSSGLFIQVVVAGPNPNAFSVNGRLELEVQNGGAWRLHLEGNITIMGPVNYTNDILIEEGIGIFVKMSIVRESNYFCFSASADVFVSVANGQIAGAGGAAPSDGQRASRDSVVSASMPYAGGVALSFGTDGWFIHIGVPPSFDMATHPRGTVQPSPSGTGPIGLRAQLALLGEVSVTSYFCVGSQVPAIPPLPAAVRALVGEIDNTRDATALASAGGFAFGAHLSVDVAGDF
ncbi:MAG: hypothetical protein HC821_05170, partial [Lewinella sp.]|nr:hypothetical protein [Lewinella sp.]